MKKTIKLTKKTAEELVRKVLGVSGKLETRTQTSEICIFKMQVGEMEVSIENDWHKRNGLFLMQISFPYSGSVTWLYFDPVTLEADLHANATAQKELREEK